MKKIFLMIVLITSAKIVSAQTLQQLASQRIQLPNGWSLTW